MRIEDEHTDVLQNIEFAIVDTYRRSPDLSDYAVTRALEALIDAYAGEGIGRPPRAFNLSHLERRLVAEMRAMCEWRLGRGAPPVAEPRKVPAPGPNPISREEIMLCLKRILTSVKKWNKWGGTQGYLEFIVQYVM